MLDLKEISYQPQTGERKIIDNLNLKVHENEVILICGNSGSGKTTLGMAILRLQSSEGDIIYRERPIHKMGYRKMIHLRSEMQVVFQDPFGSLSPRLSVGQIVAEGLVAHCIGSESEQQDTFHSNEPADSYDLFFCAASHRAPGREVPIGGMLLRHHQQQPALPAGSGSRLLGRGHQPGGTAHVFDAVVRLHREGLHHPGRPLHPPPVHRHRSDVRCLRPRCDLLHP